MTSGHGATRSSIECRDTRFTRADPVPPEVLAWPSTGKRHPAGGPLAPSYSDTFWGAVFPVEGAAAPGVTNRLTTGIRAVD